MVVQPHIKFKLECNHKFGAAKIFIITTKQNIEEHVKGKCGCIQFEISAFWQDYAVVRLE